MALYLDQENKIVNTKILHQINYVSLKWDLKKLK